MDAPASSSGRSLLEAKERLRKIRELRFGAIKFPLEQNPGFTAYNQANGVAASSTSSPALLMHSNHKEEVSTVPENTTATGNNIVSTLPLRTIDPKTFSASITNNLMVPKSKDEDHRNPLVPDNNEQPPSRRQDSLEEPSTTGLHRRPGSYTRYNLFRYKYNGVIWAPRKGEKSFILTKYKRSLQSEDGPIKVNIDAAEWDHLCLAPVPGRRNSIIQITNIHGNTMSLQFSCLQALDFTYWLRQGRRALGLETRRIIYNWLENASSGFPLKMFEYECGDIKWSRTSKQEAGIHLYNRGNVLQSEDGPIEVKIGAAEWEHLCLTPVPGGTYSIIVITNMHGNTMSLQFNRSQARTFVCWLREAREALGLEALTIIYDGLKNASGDITLKMFQYECGDVKWSRTSEQEAGMHLYNRGNVLQSEDGPIEVKIDAAEWEHLCLTPVPGGKCSIIVITNIHGNTMTLQFNRSQARTFICWLREGRKALGLEAPKTIMMPFDNPLDEQP